MRERTPGGTLFLPRAPPSRKRPGDRAVSSSRTVAAIVEPPTSLLFAAGGGESMLGKFRVPHDARFTKTPMHTRQPRRVAFLRPPCDLCLFGKLVFVCCFD